LFSQGHFFLCLFRQQRRKCFLLSLLIRSCCSWWSSKAQSLAIYMYIHASIQRHKEAFSIPISYTLQACNQHATALFYSQVLYEKEKNRVRKTNWMVHQYKWPTIVNYRVILCSVLFDIQILNREEKNLTETLYLIQQQKMNIWWR
jgi:hypothetical protein